MNSPLFPVCKCGYNPALHSDEFEWEFSEFGMFDKVVMQYRHATCKKCNECFDQKIFDKFEEKTENNMNEKRNPFQHLSGQENPQFLEDGKRIYLELRQKYPHDTDIDLDNILNGLCAAMICLMQANVEKSDHCYFLQLIHNILNKNI